MRLEGYKYKKTWPEIIMDNIICPSVELLQIELKLYILT